ncbi:MAG TPA: outer membrane beta-barrel protein [Vicinamibacterales bacterium]|nr:outer membrane beta-barrel protein [Vicinamibacterales bacterium]
MSFLSRATIVLAVFALSLGAAPTASAQEPGSIPVPLADFSGGYVFLYDTTNIGPAKDGIEFPAGWYFSAAVNPTTWFGIVGEVSGSYRNNLEVSYFDFRTSNDARVHTFMIGTRFFRKVGRVVPYAQILTGAAHMRAKIRFPGEVPGLGLVNDISSSATDFALQPGGGVTVYLTERVGVRFAGDYRSIIDFTEDENDYTNEFRMIAGFTLQWGGR